MKYLIIFIFLFGLSVPSFASTPVTVNLEDLSTQARENVLNAIQKQTTEVSSDDVEKYTALAHAVASAIQELCHTLNQEVNEFVKTPVGIITTGLLVWKIMGNDIAHYLKLMFMFPLVLSIIGFSAYKFHIPRRKKIVTEESGKKITSYEWVGTAYKWNSNDAKSLSAVLHAACVIVITLIVLLT